jgi:hypothetical protein
MKVRIPSTDLRAIATSPTAACAAEPSAKPVAIAPTPPRAAACAPASTPRVYNNKIRITADLPLGTIEILRQLAVSQGCTLTEAMRRAIATHGLLMQRIQQGARILLEAPCGSVTELVLRR